MVVSLCLDEVRARGVGLSKKVLYVWMDKLEPGLESMSCKSLTSLLETFGSWIVSVDLSSYFTSYWIKGNRGSGSKIIDLSRAGNSCSSISCSVSVDLSSNVTLGLTSGVAFFYRIQMNFNIRFKIEKKIIITWFGRFDGQRHFRIIYWSFCLTKFIYRIQIVTG